MALAVQVLVILAWFFAMAARWNDCGLVPELCDESIRIITFVGQHKLTVQSLNQNWDLRDVIDLPCGQAKAQPQPQRIHAQVQIAGEAAFAPA